MYILLTWNAHQLKWLITVPIITWLMKISSLILCCIFYRSLRENYDNFVHSFDVGSQDSPGFTILNELKLQSCIKRNNLEDTTLSHNFSTRVSISQTFNLRFIHFIALRHENNTIRRAKSFDGGLFAFGAVIDYWEKNFNSPKNLSQFIVINRVASWSLDVVRRLYDSVVPYSVDYQKVYYDSPW